MHIAVQYEKYHLLSLQRKEVDARIHPLASTLTRGIMPGSFGTPRSSGYFTEWNVVFKPSLNYTHTHPPFSPQDSFKHLLQVCMCRKRFTAESTSSTAFTLQGKPALTFVTFVTFVCLYQKKHPPCGRWREEPLRKKCLRSPL